MGKRIAFSNGRCLVNDVIRIAKKFPSAAFGGSFDAGSVARLRRLTRPKISWNVLYMKAYAKVARQYPALRQCYMGFPWPYLYEHDRNVCMLTLSREYKGEERLLFARFNNPENESLTDLQARYDYLRHAPIEEIKQFRHQVNFAKVPGLLRRLSWWVMMNLWPETRCGQIGTFGMSISGYKGVYGNQHLGPITTILGVDPVPRKGVSRLLLTFDHRVLDGVPATEIMHQLQTTLTTEIRDELAEIVGVDPNCGDLAKNEKRVHSKSNLPSQVA